MEMKIGHINTHKSRLNLIRMGNLTCKDNKIDDRAKMNEYWVSVDWMQKKRYWVRKSVEMVWSYEQENQM